jgi:hypothetical protein
VLDWGVLLIWLSIPALVLGNSLYVWFFFRAHKNGDGGTTQNHRAGQRPALRLRAGEERKR